jgi:hypothetical protein
LTDWVKRALTRRNVARNGLNEGSEPDTRLVLGVKFAIGITLCLTALEIANLAFLGTWNSEVFASITGLTGTITGILISQKSK